MSQAPGAVERRRHPRYQLLAQVRITRGKVDIVMELSNISASGALLHMGKLKRPAWVAVDRVLEIGIVHPEDFEVIELMGRIVRIVEDEAGVLIGVCFEELTESASDGVTRLLASARRAPPPLPAG